MPFSTPSSHHYRCYHRVAAFDISGFTRLRYAFYVCCCDAILPLFHLGLLLLNWRLVLPSQRITLRLGRVVQRYAQRCGRSGFLVIPFHGRVRAASAALHHTAPALSPPLQRNLHYTTTLPTG
jgi:hypothetical protein